MKTTILIVLSVFGVAYFIYWLCQIILRATKEIYDRGYKNGVEDGLKFLDAMEEKTEK